MKNKQKALEPLEFSFLEDHSDILSDIFATGTIKKETT